jgi:hypothetical protein
VAGVQVIRIDEQLVASISSQIKQIETGECHFFDFRLCGQRNQPTERINRAVILHLKEEILSALSLIEHDYRLLARLVQMSATIPDKTTVGSTRDGQNRDNCDYHYFEHKSSPFRRIQLFLRKGPCPASPRKSHFSIFGSYFQRNLNK